MNSNTHPQPARTHPPRFDTSPEAAPGVAAAASRFFVSVRRSFSPPSTSRRRVTDIPRAIAMYSTPEERLARNTSRAGYLDSRPTIEQIAMGLHVSRTPHLRPVPSPLGHRHPPLPPPPPRRTHDVPTPSPRASPEHRDESSSPSSQHHTRRSLPPPPARSSMKKRAPSDSTLTPSPQQCSSEIPPSASMATADDPLSSVPSRSLSSLRVRVSKLFPGYRPLSVPSSFGRASSFTSSASDSTRPTTPRKAVRFSTSVLAIEEPPS